jgi:biopolymer transport protein ExbD
MDRIFAVTFAGLGVVLLMVAMSVTPMYVCGPNLQYPSARSAHSFAGTEHDLPITIKSDDSILVGMDAVAAEKLQSYMPTVCRVGERPVVIQADRQATMKAVRTVVAALAAVGIRRVTIRTASATNL